MDEKNQEQITEDQETLQTAEEIAADAVGSAAETLEEAEDLAGSESEESVEVQAVEEAAKANAVTPEKKAKKRNIAWGAMLVNMAVLVVLLLAGAVLIQPQSTGMLIGAVVYFVLSTVLKMYFLRYQRKGMKLAQARKFDEAALEFEKSFLYFKEHPAIDKYRAITMLDYSNFCYGEISLVNAGACCAMKGDYEAARTWYRKAMEEFPKGTSAEEALNKLEHRLAQEEAARKNAVALTDENGNPIPRRSGGFSKYDE